MPLSYLKFSSVFKLHDNAGLYHHSQQLLTRYAMDMVQHCRSKADFHSFHATGKQLYNYNITCAGADLMDLSDKQVFSKMAAEQQKHGAYFLSLFGITVIITYEN